MLLLFSKITTIIIINKNITYSTGVYCYIICTYLFKPRQQCFMGKTQSNIVNLNKFKVKII